MACLVFLAGLSASLRAQVNVLTYHNDNARTGQNSQETILTPGNVNKDSFGLLFTYPVDGYVYAQPLYLSNVSIPGKGAHNVVYVATEHDSVYAFDADDNTGPNAVPLWHVNLIPSGGSTVTSDDVGTADVVPEIGITGTPVIDGKTGTLYVVAKTKENGSFVQRLHALDVQTGAEKFGGPVVIQGSTQGTGDGSSGGVLPFSPWRQHQRAALLLLNGIVYIAWAAHGDNGIYHGWIMGYDAATLQQKYVYCASPNAKTDPSGYPLAGGGIWQAGAGPAADAGGNIYFMTGNGTFSANLNGGRDYGDSFVKVGFNFRGLFGALDYFTPYNQDSLNRADADLGSGGVLALPDEAGSAAHRHLLVGAGKEGTIYLVDRDNMGHYHDPNQGQNNDNQIVQSIQHAIGGVWGMPAYFQNTIYYQGNGDVLKAFSIANAQLSTTPVHQSFQVFNYPGATPSISANGAAASPLGTGIVWVIESAEQAILHAYRADDVSQELYNSNQAGARDQPGGYVKFSVPTIANGKVYVGAQYALAVYGNARFVDTPQILPNGGEYRQPVSVTILETTPGAEVHVTTDGSEPTPASPLYNGAFTVSESTLVRARAFAPGLHASAIATAPFLVDDGPGDGDGLLATYYDHIDFSGPTVTRVDQTVDFDWAGGSPAPGIAGNNWSARWTGWILPRGSGEYTFTTISDDGIRLWINNQLVIDNWTYHAPTEDHGKITLTGGQKVPIKIEFFQGGGYSIAQLFWASPFWNRQVVPQSQLFSGLKQTTVAEPQILPLSGMFNPSVTVTITDATPGAEIHYTLDGSEPTQNSPLYSAAFTLTDSAVVQARAFKTGYSASAIASATFTLNLNPVLYAINSGGNAASPFSADDFYQGGTGHTRVGDVDTSQVTNPAPQAVYQAERLTDQFTPFFTYTLPNLNPGHAYLVRLHFAESVQTLIGQRVFHVTLNGKQVLTNFDIIAAAGGHHKAIVEEFVTNADENGQITLRFDDVIYHAKVSGIEVLSNEAPAVATPVIKPGGGLFVNQTQVSITDATANAQIHYTTDDSDPTEASPLYTAPFPLTQSAVVKARAYKVGYAASGIARAAFQAVKGRQGGKSGGKGFPGGPGGPAPHGPGAGTTLILNYPTGFRVASSLTRNGSCILKQSRLRLTDGGYSEAGSFFTNTPVNIRAFETWFRFQILNGTDPSADGLTFCIQRVGPNALGSLGGGLGYGPDPDDPGGPSIGSSVAIKFDLYDNRGEGNNATGLFTGGVSPTTANSVDLTGTGIDLHSGHVFLVTMNYNGATLNVQITDTVTNASARQSYPIDIPGAVGADTAYLGFTGGTGGLTAIQDILGWVYKTSVP
jgi:hypothetical protein